MEVSRRQFLAGGAGTALSSSLVFVDGREAADNVLLQAQKAQQEGRYQATLELCEAVLANDGQNQAARKMKIASLMALSRTSINMPTVNYYKSFAWMKQKKL